MTRSNPPAPSEPAAEPPAGAGRVLILTEQTGAGEVLRALLFAAGVRGAMRVCGLAAARAAFEDGAYDLVAVDCDLGAGDWDELLGRIRGGQPPSGAAVLVFAAAEEGAKIRAAVRAGVDAVVVKPAAPDAIRRRLQAVRPQPGCAFLELEDLDLPAARAS